MYVYSLNIHINILKYRGKEIIKYNKTNSRNYKKQINTK